MNNKQRGVALVFVLMLTTVAGLVVLTSLNSSATQERMAGNFQKNLNAEWQAERATFESFNRLNALIRENPSASESELLAMAQFSSDGSGARQFASSAGWQGDQLDLATTGMRYADALARRNARLRLVSSPGSSGHSPFASGVIGCDGVGLSGSADISNYSSRGEPLQDNVVVKTVRDGADIALTGASEIDGDILSTGSIELGTSKPIAGRLHANQDIRITSTAHISGTVQAVGAIAITNSAVLEMLAHANESIAISGFSSLKGGAQSRSTLTISNLNTSADHGDFAALGLVSMPNWIASALDNTIRSAEGVSPITAGAVDPTLQIEPVPLLPVDQSDSSRDDYAPLCDPLNIVAEVQQLDAQLSSELPVLLLSGTDQYRFTSNQGSVQQGNFELTVLPQTANFLDDSRAVFGLDSLHLSASTGLRIEGNIALYVRGDVSFKGASLLTITEGSSLTLIVGGTVDMSAGLKILDDDGQTPQGINAEGYPVLAIYSGYQSQNIEDIGVRFQGGVEDAYAAIYAPEAHLDVRAALRLRGAFVGKTIQLSGDGHLLFDQALRDTSPGGGHIEADPPRFVFEGWF